MFVVLDLELASICEGGTIESGPEVTDSYFQFLM